MASLVAGCGPQDPGEAQIPGISGPLGKGDGIVATTAADCPGGAPRLPGGAPAAWTVIIWSAGDNNLEEALVEDINEMERGHQGSAQVNVLVQLDRYYERGSWRYRIGPDTDPEVIASELVGHTEEELDSGEWRNLAAFGEWATVCYPAERYAVVVEGHGGGWSPPPEEEVESESETETENENETDDPRVREAGDPVRLIAPDDTNDSSMSVDQLRRALDHIRGATRREMDPSWLNRLSLYGSDACLMQTSEVAYDLRNTALNIVGSADTEPGPGWPYYSIMRDLTTRPFHHAMTPGGLSRVIVERFGASYGVHGGQGERTAITLASVDGRRMIRARNAVGRIAGLMTELLPDLLRHLRESRSVAPRYGRVYVDMAALFVDLRTRLIAAGQMPDVGTHWSGDERWRDLRKEIDGLVVDLWPELVTAAYIGEDHPGARGLSLYFPRSRNHWSLSFDEYSESAFAQDSGWAAFLDAALEQL